MSLFVDKDGRIFEHSVKPTRHFLRYVILAELNKGKTKERKFFGESLAVGPDGPVLQIFVEDEAPQTAVRLCGLRALNEYKLSLWVKK